MDVIGQHQSLPANKKIVHSLKLETLRCIVPLLIRKAPLHLQSTDNHFLALNCSCTNIQVCISKSIILIGDVCITSLMYMSNND